MEHRFGPSSSRHFKPTQIIREAAKLTYRPLLPLNSRPGAKLGPQSSCLDIQYSQRQSCPLFALVPHRRVRRRWHSIAAHRSSGTSCLCQAGRNGSLQLLPHLKFPAAAQRPMTSKPPFISCTGVYTRAKGKRKMPCDALRYLTQGSLHSKGRLCHPSHTSHARYISLYTAA